MADRLTHQRRIEELLDRASRFMARARVHLKAGDHQRARSCLDLAQGVLADCERLQREFVLRATS